MNDELDAMYGMLLSPLYKLYADGLIDGRFICGRCNPFPTEEKMRFEIKEVKNETINQIYPDVWEIVDNCDSESPINVFRASKTSAKNLCDWLNQNIRCSFKQEVMKVVEKLWNEGEVLVDFEKDEAIITEIKKTWVTKSNIQDKFEREVTVKVYPITNRKYVYKINEVKE